MSDSLPPEQTFDTLKKKHPLSLLRKILIALCIFFFLLLLLSAAVGFCRDRLVKMIVCKGGTSLAGTPVELQEFSSTPQGKITLKGFSVKNPKGYSYGNALEFKEVQIEVDLKSLLTRTIILKRIWISGLRVNYETRLTESNIGALQNNLNRSGQKDPAASQQTDQAEKNKTEQPRKLLISLLETVDSSAAFNTTAINQPIYLPLPPVVLKDVGGGSFGETLGYLTAMLRHTVTQTILGAGGSLGKILKQAGSSISQEVKNQGSEGLKILKSVTIKLK